MKKPTKGNIQISNTLSLIFKDLELPLDALVTISQVSLTSNQDQATISVSCLPFEKASEVHKILKKQNKNIAFSLAKKLNMRRVPKLFFKIDSTPEYLDQIDRRIEENH